MKNSSSSQKLDRKTIERDRRIHMKSLCFKLISLIPHHHLDPSKKDSRLSQLDQLDQGAIYIKKLKERIDELKMRKEAMLTSMTSQGQGMSTRAVHEPVVLIREMGESSLEVNLINGLMKNKSSMLYEIINIFQEEGTNVLTASFSTVGDRIFHTLHAQAKFPRIGVATSRICERLHELMHSTSFM